MPYYTGENTMATDIGIRAKLNLPYEQAVQKTIDALETEGFSVLSRIDMQAIIKQKLNVDFRRYMILGACNPPLAYQGLSANLDIGLLLPCNVIVYEDGDDSAVCAIDLVEMLSVFVGDTVVHEVALEARNRLQRVIVSLKRSGWTTS
jgi:uncharacterized protein (DUF302 family)